MTSGKDANGPVKAAQQQQQQPDQVGLEASCTHIIIVFVRELMQEQQQQQRGKQLILTR